MTDFTEGLLYGVVLGVLIDICVLIAIRRLRALKAELDRKFGADDD